MEYQTHSQKDTSQTDLKPKRHTMTELTEVQELEKRILESQQWIERHRKIENYYGVETERALIVTFRRRIWEIEGK